MKAVIIEDEEGAVQRMRRLLGDMEPSIEVVADIPTVEEAIQWFGANSAPDIAFFDVRLADGESFEIFEAVEVDCPIVFTTAYDEYALRAFKVNALDYLLKPIQKLELEQTIERIRKWSAVRDLSRLAKHGAEEYSVPAKRFLIRYGDHLKVVEPDQIAYFHSLLKNTFLRTREGKDLPMDQSLDKLEKQLDPMRFIRLNRQLIVQVDSIKELLAYSKSRLKVILDPPYDEDAVVSSERSSTFKRWLAGE